MSKKKKIWIIGGGSVVLILIVFFSIHASRKDETLVQTATVSRKDTLKAQVSASGEIRTKDYADLQAEIPGVVTAIPVREGDRVKKGDILLKIDPIQTNAAADATRARYDAATQDLRAQEFQIMNSENSLSDAKTRLALAKAQRDAAQDNWTLAQNSYKRSQQLHEDGLISREDYERAKSSLNAAQSTFEAAKAQVDQMQIQIDTSTNSLEQMKNSYQASRTRVKSQEADVTQAEDNRRKTTIPSPLGGVITQLKVHVGERAVPGTLNSPQATLMTISDMSVIQAELKVDETDIVNLALGNPVKVKVDALPDNEFDGEVTEIGNSPISATGVSQQEAKDFKVIVTLKSSTDKIRPGMSCTADITTSTRTNVLVIPIQALTIREVEVDKNGNYVEPDPNQKAKTESVARADSTKTKINKKELEGVFVITKDNHARFRPVKTGITGESEIEVLSNLKEGEVIISGSFQTLRTIKDGTLVKADNSAKPETKKSSS